MDVATKATNEGQMIQKKGLLLIISLFGLWCGGLALSESHHPPEKPSKWWEQRLQRSDIYYPHKIHQQALEQEGDSCMLCHSFAANPVKNEAHLQQLTEIANQPLKAICHDCHLDDLRAPWRCHLCHPDSTKIWPQDHHFDYIHQHGLDAGLNEKECRRCHLEISFCTDCHFRRQSGFGVGSDSGMRRGMQGGNGDYHPMGYLSRHGLEARMSAVQCSRCHNGFFCSDCHRNRR